MKGQPSRSASVQAPRASLRYRPGRNFSEKLEVIRVRSLLRRTWKLNLRRLSGCPRSAEIRCVWFESGPSCKNIVWEKLDVSVVVLHGLVVTPPFDRDAVLGASQLVLQAQKILVGLELRIILNDGEQPAECPVELAVRGYTIGGCLCAKQRGTRLGDVPQDGPL